VFPVSGVSVEYAKWAPHYERIRLEFGFPTDREEAAATLLETLLPPAARADPLVRVRHLLDGRDAIVVGLAPDAGPPPLWRRPARERPPVLVAADGATATCLAAGLVPTLVVTDLDGPVPSEIAANRRGSLVVVHGHGDNLPALSEWLPQFPGELVGSWSGPPRGPLINVGGFTDGDRAAFLSEHCGAPRILLWGFDFDHVKEPDAAKKARKLAKLAWARELLALLAKQGRATLLTWHKDGSLEPYDGGKSEASTR
jgi:2-amino-4-hydroxy-6-hydroxymethyldihydropteridine diphosphokinase